MIFYFIIKEPIFANLQKKFHTLERASGRSVTSSFLCNPTMKKTIVDYNMQFHRLV